MTLRVMQIKLISYWWEVAQYLRYWSDGEGDGRIREGGLLRD